ncbi:hypothetical protein ACROYT_G016454 [Oculina patagonica]
MDLCRNFYLDSCNRRMGENGIQSINGLLQLAFFPQNSRDDVYTIGCRCFHNNEFSDHRSKLLPCIKVYSTTQQSVCNTPWPKCAGNQFDEDILCPGFVFCGDVAAHIYRYLPLSRCHKGDLSTAGWYCCPVSLPGQ